MAEVLGDRRAGLGARAAPRLEVEFVAGARGPVARGDGAGLGTVVANRELVDMAAPGARSKRHLEIALPEGASYRPGDYLAVLPLNPEAVVERALARFGLAPDAGLVLRVPEGGDSPLPVGSPVTAGELLAGYVELSRPATRGQIGRLARAAAHPKARHALSALADDDALHTAEVLERHVTVLDLLERHPECALAFAAFLEMHAPLAPRRYSISSSPRWHAGRATLTVALVGGRAGGGPEGAASAYLGRAAPGTPIAVTVLPSAGAFRPPPSLATPMVMACAGTGIAPFRAFLQDRALRAREEGVRPAPALLFFGCDHPEVDYLYRDELAAWSEAGVVDVRTAFSAAPRDGVRYVQDRLWRDRADVVELFRAGAVFYVCGDGRRMAPAVHATCARIYREATGASPAEAEEWLTRMRFHHGRYLTDAFI
ncbi:hypothetical protein LO762_11365 [Actinocorallia sp. API 0066]|uniref:hypothetical protein n=1 Tax=Actinocorallia sp. API 0066 TaxID=2896846 RepID=UPI001E2ADDD1|nr:hypothetical protein [Actinocorallia sp. API 0066]MCD0449783.1 hypothetical protein [Actinocorallia sp. API 0066]